MGYFFRNIIPEKLRKIREGVYDLYIVSRVFKSLPRNGGIWPLLYISVIGPLRKIRTNFPSQKKGEKIKERE